MWQMHIEDESVYCGKQVTLIIHVCRIEKPLEFQYQSMVNERVPTISTEPWPGWNHPGFQNEPRQMFKNFVFKTAQTSSIADRLIFSARFSLIKHARHWFLGFYHVARHELLVLKSINISEYQSEAFSWNVLVFLRTVNFTLFLNLMFKW